MSGGHLFEASLILKLMIERKYKIQNVIIETDLNLSNEKEQTGIASKFYLTFITRSNREHFSQEKDFSKLFYIPFTGTLFSMLKLVSRNVFQFYT
jgi:UDP-N-acetylglucosamine:LPS N-acetylglucosamine transferase